MKKALSILLVLSMLLLPGISLAESWICPVCGQENDGNFCPNDAQPRPEEPETVSEGEDAPIARLWQDIEAGRLAVLDDTPIVTGKILIADYAGGTDRMPLLITRKDGERDKALFPDERMADSPDEADTVIFLYTEAGTGVLAQYTKVCADVVLPKLMCRFTTTQLWLESGLKLEDRMTKVVMKGAAMTKERLRGLTELTEVRDALRPLLENETGARGGEARYQEARGLFDQELYYSAYEAFRESGYGDWADRAVSCIQPLPDNGEAWKNYLIPITGMQLTISINQAEDSNFFARVYLDGEAYTGLFIRGTGSETVDLPGGTYAIKAGTGDVWFGGREAFGKNGSYQVMTFDNAGSETVEFQSGYAYTLSLNVEQGSRDVGDRRANWEEIVQ